MKHLKDKIPSWKDVEPNTWDKAQHLRRHMTVAEKKLWHALRCTALENRIRRQHPIGPYIADFYIPSAQLVIEVDGATHDTPKEIEHDSRRTAYLESCGIRVLRYNNTAVIQNLRGVLEHLLSQIENAPPTPPRAGGT
jgi:very-short-patch-repair endonuclease